jgi:hypothetical protein
MNRTGALIVSLAIGLAAVAGVFALASTVSLGNQAHDSNAKKIAQRTAQLNRYEATLRKALAQQPPPLPPVPRTTGASSTLQSAVGAPAASASPVRVVYNRPPPIVVVKHRAGGEHEVEGRGADD